MLAVIVRSSLFRLIPVGMVMLALQRSIFSEIRVSGVIVQVVLATVVAAGAAGGSERGALAGFTLGVMFDMAEGTPIGSTAMAFTLAGVAAGLLALVAADPQWWLNTIFVGFGAAVGEVMLPVVRVFIGERDPWPTDMIKIVVIVTAAAMLMSPILVPLGRWCLRIRGSKWMAPADAAAL